MSACPQSLDIPTILAYILAAVNIVLGLASSIGNFIVFFIIFKSKNLHTRSNFCLMSLATTDLLVGLVSEPLHIMQLFSAEYRSNCQINSVRRFLAALFLGASIGSIAVVSYDRYMHLSKTLNYRQHMPKKKIACLLTIAWMVPLAIIFTRYISEFVYEVILIIYICTIIAIMVTCYLFIIRIVKNGENSLRTAIKTPKRPSDDENSKQKTSSREMKSHIKAARAIMFIIGALFVTFAPILTYFAIAAISSLLKLSIFTSTTSRDIGYACSMTIAMANSAMNPVIYYLRIPEFRVSFKRYVRFLCPVFARRAQNQVGCETVCDKYMLSDS